jgi:hypothetical protein
LIEHLLEDPMHPMCEVNRILKPGPLRETTLNTAALRDFGHPSVSPRLPRLHPGPESGERMRA